MSTDRLEQGYYGRPILKAPVWKPVIPAYFAVGGLAGASSVLAAAADLAGNRRLARTASLTSAAALRGVPAAADLRPRPAGALRQHAAGAQADVADERRLVAAGRRLGGAVGGRRLRGHPVVPAGRPRGTAGRRRARPGDRDVHGRAGVRHRGAGVGRGARRAACAVRRRRRDQRRGRGRRWPARPARPVRPVGSPSSAQSPSWWRSGRWSVASARSQSRIVRVWPEGWRGAAPRSRPPGPRPWRSAAAAVRVSLGSAASRPWPVRRVRGSRCSRRAAARRPTRGTSFASSAASSRSGG